MNHEKINLVLDILMRLINKSPKYYHLYLYIKTVKQKTPDFFSLYSHEGLTNLQFVLESTELSYKVGSEENRFNAFTEITNLCIEFSILSGFETQEWKVFLEYITESYFRLHLPTSKEVIKTSAHAYNHPWFIIICLLPLIKITN